MKYQASISCYAAKSYLVNYKTKIQSSSEILCNCKMSKLSDTIYKTSNLLEKSSSLSLNSLIIMNNKTYMTKHHVNVKHTKMYIISKTHYLSFTCRCSCVAPVCLVSAHQTISICSRPPPPPPPGPGLLLSISSSFIRRNVRYYAPF